ncbi:MAG: sugar phosphate isomerase/epimerase family protein [Gemmataceae bacterium]
MQIGFVTAILPELTFKEVLEFAAEEGFDCVEVMCWPPGGADRRYGGVVHIDVTHFTSEYAEEIRDLVRTHGVTISALGYYPNPLDPQPAQRRVAEEHLRKVIDAAPRLGVDTVTTFIGRDPAKTVEDNWPTFQTIWPALVQHAESRGIKIALENCPMLFSNDEWPGGKNLVVSPAIWRTIFQEIPSKNLGLNFDPSHLVWQHIDYLRCLREFAQRIYHVHAKDTRIDPDRLYERGILGLGWHTPKIPGFGDVEWGQFFSVLSDTGYRGPVCIEVEDRAFEGSLDDRKRALRQSKRFLEQFVT